MQFAWAFDYVLFNENKEAFLKEAENVVAGELARKEGFARLFEKRRLFDSTLKT